MDFDWSSAQRELYGTVRRFAASPALTQAQVEGRRAQRSRLQACGRTGLLGLSIPECHGGLGLDATTAAIAYEAFGRGCSDMGLVFACGAHLNACALPIAEAADEDVKRRMLPRLCEGGWIGANAISEAEAGSDVAAMRMRAVRDGDDYVLHGEKSWVTNAPLADVFTVYAVTNPAAGYLGISAFAVERERPGITVGEAFHKVGLSSALTAPVHFEDCRVPAAQRLGAEGAGLAVFNRSMLWERSCLFAGYVGAMQRQLEQTVAYAKQRRQFRRPIARNQAVAHRIVDMRVRLEAARMLLYRATWTLDRGLDATEAISIAKLVVSESAVQSGLDAVRVHGGLGVVADSGVPAGLLDALPCTVFSGTSDIQRNLIARELGL